MAYEASSTTANICPITIIIEVLLISMTEDVNIYSLLSGTFLCLHVLFIDLSYKCSYFPEIIRLLIYLFPYTPFFNKAKTCINNHLIILYQISFNIQEKLFPGIFQYSNVLQQQCISKTKEGLVWIDETIFTEFLKML